MVKLIAITRPEDPELDSEKLLAYIARVSSPQNQDNHQTAGKLLRYLVKNKHWSPFEMVHLVIEIECSRAIARQILRHRSFSFQEFSQRYAEINDDMFAIVEARLQDSKDRQNSIDISDAQLKLAWEQIQYAVIQHTSQWYRQAVARGIAKEQARVLLPEGLTKSRLYVSGSLRSWIHYCQLRMGHGTQKEHQVIATECWSILTEQFPSLASVLSQPEVPLQVLESDHVPSKAVLALVSPSDNT